MVVVQGVCDARFAPMRERLEADLADGVDEGASIAVVWNGELVVDLWGGYADLGHMVGWEADTVVRVASTSKLVPALAAVMLWDRGLIDLDAPMADYWPAFGGNGKGAVTARQVLTHTSGVPGFGTALAPGEKAVVSWDATLDRIERTPLWYKPGTVVCYHALTFGHLLGGLVEHVTGKRYDEFVAEEITGPLGADFRYPRGRPGDGDRLAEHRDPETLGDLTPVPGSVGERVFIEFLTVMAQLTEEDLMADVHPGGNGIANARALAQIGSIIAGRGEVNGRKYLTAKTVEEIGKEQSTGFDEFRCDTIRRGLHFALHTDTFPAPTPTTIHWGGYGGSWATMDPASGISAAYAPNHLLLGDPQHLRQAGQWQALTDALANLG